MPGIFCCLDRIHRAGCSETLRHMLHRAKHHPWYVVESYTDDAAGAALGRISLGFVNRAKQPVAAEDGSMVAVMDGELYDYAAQRTALEAEGRRFSGDSHAEVLLHGYCCKGKEFFAGLNGKFVAAIWDGHRGRLIATNDRFGMRLLYYACPPGGLLLASEIKSLFACPEVSRKPSMRGIAQFLSFGQYLGEDTSFEAVRILPPAAWAVYDLADGRLTVDRYWRCGVPSANGCSQGELLERIDCAFKNAVDCRTSGTDRLGISLSGGLDARSVLAVMDHDRAPITSVALGIPGSRDHRSAAQLAALTNRRHHNYVLRQDFLADFETHLDQMVRLTDGQYLSQCVVMPTLPYYRELRIEVLLRGHAGELMHMSKAYNFSLDRRSLGIRDEGSLLDWAFRHLRAYMLEAVNGSILTQISRQELNSLALESLRDSMRQWASWEPPVQQVWPLFLTERSRRETALALVKFGSLLETRLPYVDNDLVDLLMAAPPEMKLDETIQGYILRKRRPEFLDVINVNTGTRIGASRLARCAASFRQRVLSKLRVPGYQPYERLGLWLRRELRPLVEKILLTERCLGRGVFSPDAVRSVVRQHFANQRNHTFLLMALIILEVGQRQLVDSNE